MTRCLNKLTKCLFTFKENIIAIIDKVKIWTFKQIFQCNLKMKRETFPKIVHLKKKKLFILFHNLPLRLKQIPDTQKKNFYNFFD